MMGDKNLLFSPWFRIIFTKWMIADGGWWDDLDKTMTSNKNCDYVNIHTFDPPSEHMGGGGSAGPMFVNTPVGGDTS
jgi:hypothetical protein